MTVHVITAQGFLGVALATGNPRHIRSGKR
jgi:hypothetical protein